MNVSESQDLCHGEVVHGVGVGFDLVAQPSSFRGPLLTQEIGGDCSYTDTI